MTSHDLPEPADETAGLPAAAERLSVRRYESTFSGPLPSPSDLAAYGQISPDLVERIVAASDQQREHRHRMDVLQARRDSWGLAAGFVVAVLFLLVAAWLIDGGHEIAGVVLGTVDLVALTAVFVLGRRSDDP